jgi:hypothetical protein
LKVGQKPELVLRLCRAKILRVAMEEFSKDSWDIKAFDT